MRIEVGYLLDRARFLFLHRSFRAILLVVAVSVFGSFFFLPIALPGFDLLVPGGADELQVTVPGDTTEGKLPQKLPGIDSPRGPGGRTGGLDPHIGDTTKTGGQLKGDEESPAGQDTAYVVCLDSTARMRYFNPLRRDHLHVEFFPRRVHPLFAARSSSSFRREVTLDTTGANVRFRETVAGHDVRVPLELPLKDYILLRQAHELRKMLADEARKPPVDAGKDDLGELLSTITQIQIPVPPNPIFSIFGKPEINLNISGAVDIKAGFRNTKSDQATFSPLDQTRNEPDFSQEVQVNVNGTIGDKLNILADWNTQRTFEYENQLKIKYTGYDDEIVRNVEAGNVSLQTPSAFIGSSQALFGVKAQFQAGPLMLTTLASQKKGQIKEVSVSGGVQESPFEIRAYNYATNHFFVDTSYIQYYEPYYQALESPPVTPDVQILEEEVWVQRIVGIPDPNERHAVAYIGLLPRGAGYDSSLRTISVPLPGEKEVGQFVRLDRTQYELAGGGYIGVLSLNTNVQDAQIVAIAYRTADGTQVGEFARDLTDTTGNKPLILKMVKPQNLQARGPGYRTAWRMMLKNIYSLGGRNLKKEGFTLDILRTIAGAEAQNSILNEPLIRVLGLDRLTPDGTIIAGGDGVFDFSSGRTVNTARSELIFPTLRPFDEGIRAYFSGLPSPIVLDDTSEFRYKEIYDTTSTFARQSNRDKYIIRGKATGEASSKYSLGFNVVEGSVQVLLDGRALAPNVDYTVDYIIGEVVIRNDRALVPGANLQIKFEQNDLFQLASKTLLGARGDLAISQRTNFGFTIMNLNQQTLSDKVRLGEEPNNNTIFGIDGATSLDLPFLTRAIDALPLLQTREASQIKFSGEAAYMLPDPNTRKSTIPSDGGEGIAYIDDFEGTRRTIPLGVNYTQWSLASPLADSVSQSLFRGTGDTATFSKGKIVWFNQLPTNVALTDIFPRKLPGNAANNQITVMDIRYVPGLRGQYNYSLDLGSTLTPQRNWGGVMKPISISPTNLITENVNFIEIWMQVNRPSSSLSRDTMFIDMGAISEDVIPNRDMNSEDKVLSRNANGTLQEGEDIGLDMLSDLQEIQLYPSLGPDPSGDNYVSRDELTDYSGVNGTENSRNSPEGQFPDTEDLNNNNTPDQANSYFQYAVPLDTTVANNPLIVGGGNKGWYQFRIPVREWTSRIGSPSFEIVEFFRIAFRNTSDTIAIRIADISLVGNQWQELRKDDSTFAVSVVNVEDNPEYEIPPGVIRERDKTRPEENVQANEQSLALLLNGIPDGEAKQAVKYYTYRPLDLFNYKTMKMFVHGDRNFVYMNERDYDADVFFRFGLDTLNFYEYRAPLRPGWDPLNEVVINFEDLTATKQGRDSTNRISAPIPVPGGPPGSVYRVLGNPSLTQIRYLALGVENPKGVDSLRPGKVLRGQVWFNELRVTSVDDSPGWAYRFDTQMKIADLGTVSFNYSKIDPSFHTLEQRFGSRQTGTNWGLSTSAQLERFFPTDWVGTSFPVSYSHSENLVKPKYLPSSDVIVDEAAARQAEKVRSQGGTEAEAQKASSSIITASQTRRVTDTYAAPTFRLGLPSQAWYIRDTFNKLSFGFNYTRSTERSPATERRLSWQWSARIGYALSLPSDYYFSPFKDLFDGIWLLDEYKGWKIYFAPGNFSWSVNATRSRDVSLQRVPGATEIVSRNFTASRQFGFGWKLTEGGLLNLSGDYGLNIESSLLHFETDRFNRQRPFSRILDQIFFSDRFIDFGQDTRYGQRNQFNTKPNIPNLFNIKKYLDLSAGYGVDYGWQNTLRGDDAGKSAQFTNSINLGMTFRLKQLFDPLFAGTSEPASPGGRGGRGAGGRGEPQQDSVKTSDTTSPDMQRGVGRSLAQLGNVAATFLKTLLLDYDNISVTFTESNTAQNNGVVGRTGFVNFWGRVPFLQEHDPQHGPSRLYQLGLISDPSGRLTNFGFRPRFPFFGWDVEPGIRARGVVLANNFNQTNRLTFRTSRPLWEGARLDLNWNIGWSYSRVQSIQTDSVLGMPRIINSTTRGSVERSFLTFPDVLFLGVFKSSLKDVSTRYGELKNDQDTSLTDEEKLSKAFEEGFEALPFLNKAFGQFYPRVNWALRWDGLEKLSFFSGFVERLSLDHSYSSTYTRQYRNVPGGGGEQTEGQRVAYGFAPLAGLNFTFKELFKGSLGANVRFNTNTSYDLATSSRNIVETLAQEISVTATYTRRGFEIPLFGLALNNDLDVSGSYSVTKNSRKTYDVALLDVNAEGTPLEGSTRTVLEPRIRYVLSSRVTASIYYRYTKIAPDESGSLIPGSTTNEAGLDIHISIQ